MTPKQSQELDLVIREILMTPLVGAMVERGIELPRYTCPTSGDTYGTPGTCPDCGDTLYNEAEIGSAQ